MARTAERRDISFEERWRSQIRILLTEHDDMQERIRQRRAAVKIYEEMVRRLDCPVQAE